MKIDRRTILKTIGTAVAMPAIGRSAQAQATDTIVIGGSVPLSGRAAETGLNVNNGYLAAQKLSTKSSTASRSTASATRSTYVFSTTLRTRPALRR